MSGLLGRQVFGRQGSGGKPQLTVSVSALSNPSSEASTHAYISIHVYIVSSLKCHVYT